MEPLKLKKGHFLIYVALLVGVLFIMLFTRNLAVKGDKQHDDYTNSSDSLNVAIKISPIGVCAIGDSLGGFYYDLMQQLVGDDKIKLTINGITNATSALNDLGRGNYDIVISDIIITSNIKDKYMIANPIESINDELALKYDVSIDSICAWNIVTNNEKILDAINHWIANFSNTKQLDI